MYKSLIQIADTCFAEDRAKIVGLRSVFQSGTGLAQQCFRMGAPASGTGYSGQKMRYEGSAGGSQALTRAFFQNFFDLCLSLEHACAGQQ